MVSKGKIAVLLAILISLWLSIFYLSNKNEVDYLNVVRLIKSNDIKKDDNIVRDFHRYKCKNIQRIGGREDIVNKVNNPLYRIDGAWFTCLDKGFELIENTCTVFSFGISSDYSFDEKLNKQYS